MNPDAGELLAVDPGLESTGWAFYDAARLIMFDVLRPARGTNLIAVINYVLRSLPSYSVCSVVVERMTYRGANTAGNPQGLLDLQLLAGAIGGAYSLRQWVTPQQWKGTLPIDTLVRRYLAPDSWLGPEHRATLAMMRGRARSEFSRAQRDAAAAIGIGRYALGLPL